MTRSARPGPTEERGGKARADRVERRGPRRAARVGRGPAPANRTGGALWGAARAVALGGRRGEDLGMEEHASSLIGAAARGERFGETRNPQALSATGMSAMSASSEVPVLFRP
jgi:hypothetical protein